MMKITVWELPNCVQCHQTKREFTKRGIVFETRQLNKSQKAVKRFLELGFSQAPIIETDDRRWSGFRLDKINSLAMHLKSERAHGINVPMKPIKQVAEEIADDE
jgi:glutaredoxin-like protein NrdH